jgi:alpha/beta superfamily hydrolase
MLRYDLIERSGSTATAILLHPHPDMGGDRHHPVVTALYDGLPTSALRFDFTSSSVPAARAEVDEAIALAPDTRVVLIGYSFGADIALTVDDPRALGWFAVAPPLIVVDPETMAAAGDARPKRLAIPELDQFSRPERAERLTSTWTATSVVTIAGGDHFLVGRSGAVLDAVVEWWPSVVGPR